MNDVAPSSWPRVVWWSFYEGDASFDQFLVEAVQHLNNEKLEADDLSGRNAVTKLLGIVRKPGTLLVLDGFERVLRAFGGLSAAYQGDTPTMATDDDSRGTYCGAGEANRDCVSPLAQLFLNNLATRPDVRSKVLLTTRLCPRAIEATGGGLLQGCQEYELLQMQSADAVDFFHIHF